LESLFWPISLCDEITLEEGLSEKGVSMVTDSLCKQEFSSIDPEKNLAWRALQSLFPFGPPYGVSIKKRIPLGGGLGGGSSNAGTILRHFKTPSPELIESALSLGADVPFFLQSKPAWVTGVGEKVHPLFWQPENRLYFLLVLLPEPTPTKAVFDELRRKNSFSRSFLFPTRQSLTIDSLRHYLEHVKNDLEAPAEAVNPLISLVLKQLRALPARHVALSGSGSTCFALFDDEAARQESDKAIQQFCRDHQCRTLSVETFTET